MGANEERPPKQCASFREALLHVNGVSDEEEVVFDECEDKELPENRRYKENLEPEIEVTRREGSAPVIHVTDEELSQWSEPWLLTLVVNVMGKKLIFECWRIS